MRKNEHYFFFIAGTAQGRIIKFTIGVFPEFPGNFLYSPLSGTSLFPSFPGFIVNQMYTNGFRLSSPGFALDRSVYLTIRTAFFQFIKLKTFRLAPSCILYAPPYNAATKCAVSKRIGKDNFGSSGFLL
jgi:hypothetical protein